MLAEAQGRRRQRSCWEEGVGPLGRTRFQRDTPFVHFPGWVLRLGRTSLHKMGVIGLTVKVELFISVST